MNGIDLAVSTMGSQSALARALGKKPQIVQNWQKNIGRIPAEHVPEVARVTGLPRHLLRPDLYERPPQQESKGDLHGRAGR